MADFLKDVNVAGSVVATAFVGAGSGLTGVAATIPGGTSGRVALVGASGVLTDPAGINYDAPSSTLTVTKGVGGGRSCYGLESGGTRWGVGLGDEAISYFYIGARDSLTTNWFWRANWNDGAVPGNTFRVPSGQDGVTSLAIQAVPGQASPMLALQGISSTSTVRDMAYVDAGFNTPTDASYKGFARLDAVGSGGREYGLRIDATGGGANAAFFGPGSAGSYGGGVGCVFLPDRTTAPTTDPVGGGLLYAESGQPTWRDPTGTVTTLTGGDGGGAEYSATIGDGAAADIAVAHGLGTRDVSVTIRQAATPYATALVAWDATDADTVTLHFTAAPAAGQYRATIMAGGVSGGGGTGTVTSVALTVPAGLSVSGSPVTTSGTLAVTTTLSGVLKGTGSGFAAAVAGTDYLAPTGNGSGLTGLVHNPEPNAVVFNDDVFVQGILTAGSDSQPSLASLQYVKAVIYNPTSYYVDALIVARAGAGYCGADFSLGSVNASDVTSIYYTFGFDITDVADATTRAFWLYDTPGGLYPFVVMNDTIAVGDLGGDRTLIPHLARFQVLNGTAARKGLVVRGAASQTASLQEWQNNAGTALTVVKADGTIVVSAVAAPTAAAGQLYYDSARKALGVGVGPTPMNVPLTGAVSVNTTSVTANTASSTTAQNLMSLAVPAGLLNVAGKSLRIFGAGVLSINTTATATVAVKLGAATLATWTSASITGGAGTANSPWNFDLLTATVAAGATGTVEPHGRFLLKPTTGAGAATVYNDVGTGPSAAVDLTAAQTLQVTVTFSANGAGGNANACTQRLFHVELSN